MTNNWPPIPSAERGWRYSSGNYRLWIFKSNNLPSGRIIADSSFDNCTLWLSNWWSFETNGVSNFSSPSLNKCSRESFSRSSGKSNCQTIIFLCKFMKLVLWFLGQIYICDGKNTIRTQLLSRIEGYYKVYITITIVG